MCNSRLTTDIITARLPDRSHSTSLEKPKGVAVSVPWDNECKNGNVSV